MKKITKHLTPRYVWFMMWFKQWFKNPQGITAFAHQVMNWLMQSTMALAEKLKRVNKKMAEAIKTKKAQLENWYGHPTIEADEFDEIRSKIRKLGFGILLGLVAETALNYFAIETVIQAKGWLMDILKLLVAAAVTGLCLYIFEKWFAILINKPKYKKTETKERNWVELILITLLCFGYETAFYWLCKVRGTALEGAHGDDMITNFVVIIGMLLPLVAGYLAYELSHYVSAYNNTKRIAKTEKIIAKKESTIATNNQKMQDNFKRELQNSWGLLQEFKVYKENYNIKKGIKEESIAGHYCEDHDSFEREAVKRYKKEMLHNEPALPTIIIAKEQLNGHQKELPQEIINH